MITEEEQEALRKSYLSKGSMSEWIQGFAILARYTASPHNVGADHDVVFVDVDPEIINDEDLRMLATMGWRWGGLFHGVVKYT